MSETACSIWNKVCRIDTNMHDRCEIRKDNQFSSQHCLRIIFYDLFKKICTWKLWKCVAVSAIFCNVGVWVSVLSIFFLLLIAWQWCKTSSWFIRVRVMQTVQNKASWCNIYKCGWQVCKVCKVCKKCRICNMYKGVTLTRLVYGQSTDVQRVRDLSWKFRFYLIFMYIMC